MTQEQERRNLIEDACDAIDAHGEEDALETFCPACGGPGGYMGTLGRTAWFRCQACGSDFHERTDK